MLPHSFPDVLQCLLMVSMAMVVHTQVCVDTGKMCWWWTLMKWCNPDDRYSKNQCPKRCNLCPTDPVLTPSLMVTQSTSVTQVYLSVTASISVTPAYSSSTVITSNSVSSIQMTTSSPTVQECRLPTLPFSDNVLQDMYMIGHVLSQHVVVSEVHCEDLCLRAYLCVGYNFNLDQNGLKHCQLLDHVDNFSPKLGNVFRLLDRDAARKDILGNDEFQL